MQIGPKRPKYGLLVSHCPNLEHVMISCSSSIHQGYDEPKNLCYSITQICATGADVRRAKQPRARQLLIARRASSAFLSKKPARSVSIIIRRAF